MHSAACVHLGLVTVLLSACAGQPVLLAPSAPASAPAAVAALQAVRVEGPALGLDWTRTLERFHGHPAQPPLLAELEATIAEAYLWAEWREVHVVAAPAVDEHGLLRVSVFAEPPADRAPPPTALAWPPPEAIPPPQALGGARPENAADATLAAWQQDRSRVLIDRSERRLYLKRRAGGVVSYPVAVGTARTPTPAGTYVVEAVRQNPTWYPPASIRRSYAAKGRALPPVVPPGPGNPLGEWFVRLQRAGDTVSSRSEAGAGAGAMPASRTHARSARGTVPAGSIGIHGTNQPRSIGRAVSHGCVRMHDSDVAQLVAELRAGDGVTVVHSRAALLARQ